MLILWTFTWNSFSVNILQSATYTKFFGLFCLLYFEFFMSVKDPLRTTGGQANLLQSTELSCLSKDTEVESPVTRNIPVENNLDIYRSIVCYPFDSQEYYIWELLLRFFFSLINFYCLFQYTFVLITGFSASFSVLPFQRPVLLFSHLVADFSPYQRI